MHRTMQYVSVNALPNVGCVQSANTRAYWLTYCNKYILNPCTYTVHIATTQKENN